MVEAPRALGEKDLEDRVRLVAHHDEHLPFEFVRSDQGHDDVPRMPACPPGHSKA
jgi:hypothetical protein